MPDVQPMVSIRSLGMKNFRSLGAGAGGAGATFAFRGPVSYIVGENNAGKSNVLAALRAAPLMATGVALQGSDFHLRNMNLELRLGMEVEFDGADLASIQRSISPRIQESENLSLSFLHTFVPSAEFTAVYFKGNQPTTWKTPSVTVMGASVFALTNETMRLEPPIEYDDFLRKMTPGNEDMLSQMTDRGQDPRKTGIRLPVDLTSLLAGHLTQRIAVFDEIRFRPKGTGQPATESLNGERVADVLFTLKNGGRVYRDRYELVKVKFASIFRGLELEVTGSSQSAPEITVTRASDGFEVDITRTGAGTGQVITLLTHMVGRSGHVFAIDTPESHLHPHALRTFRSFFEEASQKNQLIIATHSPLVPTRRRIGNVIVIRDEKGKSVINQPEAKEFSDEDLLKLESRMSNEALDMLFARKVIFLEGETDLGAIPILARGMSRDIDREGISLVGLGGKHFALMAKLARCLGIPYAVVCDSDALMNLESIIRIGANQIRTCPVMHELFALGALSKLELRKLRKWSPERAGIEKYPLRRSRELRAIADRHGVFAWESDLEGILTSVLSRGEAEKIYAAHRSKVIRGRFLADTIVANGPLPEKLGSRLRLALRLPR